MTTNTTVRYTGWQPDNAEPWQGVIVLTSGQSALVDVDGVRRWVDMRNLEEVSGKA